MVLPAPPELTESERKWLMAIRQTLIMQLGATEERLGMERSIVPKRKREVNNETEMKAEDYGIIDRTYYSTED